MLELQRSETLTPHPAIVLAGQNLASGETTWTAEPHVGETTFSDAGERWGTDYMHARYYKPIWGRFLSVDPSQRSARAEAPQTWNRYSYARSNPLNRIDPDGAVDRAAWADHARVVRANGGPKFDNSPEDTRIKQMSLGPLALVSLPMLTLAASPEAAGVIVVSQASNAISGAISSPQNRVGGAFVAGLVGTGTGAVTGGPIVTPLKNFVGGVISSNVTSGQTDRNGVAAGTASGVAVGWLELAAKVNGNLPGGAALKSFAVAMDAALQILGAVGTAPDEPATPTCQGGSTCQDLAVQ